MSSDNEQSPPAKQLRRELDNDPDGTCRVCGADKTMVCDEVAHHRKLLEARGIVSREIYVREWELKEKERELEPIAKPRVSTRERMVTERTQRLANDPLVQDGGVLPPGYAEAVYNGTEEPKPPGVTEEPVTTLNRDEYWMKQVIENPVEYRREVTPDTQAVALYTSIERMGGPLFTPVGDAISTYLAQVRAVSPIDTVIDHIADTRRTALVSSGTLPTVETLDIVSALAQIIKDLQAPLQTLTFTAPPEAEPADTWTRAPVAGPFQYVPAQLAGQVKDELCKLKDDGTTGVYTKLDVAIRWAHQLAIVVEHLQRRITALETKHG